jgi:uncharacterized protein (DUF2461 family)
MPKCFGNESFPRLFRLAFHYNMFFAKGKHAFKKAIPAPFSALSARLVGFHRIVRTVPVFHN